MSRTVVKTKVVLSKVRICENTYKVLTSSIVPPYDVGSS